MAEGEKRLCGRTALVTGGGNGLGRAIAMALGAAGTRVVIAGRSEAALADTARQAVGAWPRRLRLNG